MINSKSMNTTKMSVKQEVHLTILKGRVSQNSWNDIFILGNKCLRNYCGFQSDNSCKLSGAFYERILYFIANGA